MSTRSIIARQLENGFEGVYHHWDGYPSGLGATLYKMYHSLGANLENLLEDVIDKHPSGWVTLNETPECFCHRSDPDHDTRMANNIESYGANYAYTFEKDIHKETDLMHIYLRKYDSSERWTHIASVDLTNSAPNWNELDDRWKTFEPKVKDKQSSLQY